MTANNLRLWHDAIVAELGRARPLAQAMAALIDQCATANPHPDWAGLREVPWGDVSPLLEWLPTPFREEPPGRPLKGLWFGLFNPCPDGRTPVADLYVCGSERFDPDPDDNTWAVGPDWWPKSRYARSQVLADIYRIAYRQRADTAAQPACLGNTAEFPLCLGYAAFAVRELLRRIEPSDLLGRSESLGIAVGFDSGAFVLLGDLTCDGLTTFDPHAPRPEIPLEPVLAGLRSTDSRTIYLAMLQLRRLGPRARPAVPDLLRIAGTSDDWRLRRTAVHQLAAVAPDDTDVRIALLQTLDDAHSLVRREALQAGPSSPASPPPTWPAPRP